MFEERYRPIEERDRGAALPSVVMLLFRLAVVAAFITLAGRLFQLQVVSGSQYEGSADANRFRLVEEAAPRGVVYDKSGQILVRNRPSFEVSLVPDDLTEDDPDTKDVDEEAVEIAEVLRMLRVDTDGEAAIRMAELMFRNLGRRDFAAAVEAAGIPLNYVLVPGPVETIPSEDGGEPEEVSTTMEIPDISQPLPFDALVALVKRAVSLKRMGSASEPTPILDLVNRIRALEVVEQSYRIPAVRVSDAPVREYVYGDLFSHVLGFMGPIPAALAEDYKASGYTNPNERVGLNGLEYSYQTELRGVPGYRNIEVDILGRETRTVGQVLEPVPGSNLILNIDRRLQQILREELQAGMEEVEAPWAVAIAMNPMNGAVMGMVSLPSYDNNIFAESINEDYLALERDKRRPLINYAIGGLYPPGSTFKMVTATAALAEGVIDADTTVVDAGPIYLPNKYFPDDMSQAQRFVSWNHKYGISHGALNVVGALKLSNDIWFYVVGGGYPPTNFVGLGQRKMSAWMELYGYGDPTGVDLPGEVGAIIPTDQWKRQLYAETWTTGDSYNMSIGQGYVLATPLQVLVSTAAVANGGIVYEPRLVYQVQDATGGLQRDYEPVERRRLPVEPADMALVQEGMWEVVNAGNGTGTAGRVEGVSVAGKTGTAEFCEYLPEEEDCRRTEDDHLPTHAWYVTYAPYEAPEIALVVFVYDGGEGSATATPIAQRMLQRYFTEVSPRALPVETAAQP